MALSIAGCASGPGPTTGIPCEALAPLRPSLADLAALSADLKRQILVYNETGAAACGWRAR